MNDEQDNLQIPHNISYRPLPCNTGKRPSVPRLPRLSTVGNLSTAGSFRNVHRLPAALALLDLPERDGGNPLHALARNANFCIELIHLF